MKNISKSIDKVDAHEKIAGETAYISDIKREDMVYAMTLRSPVASGTIRNITLPTLPEGYAAVGPEDIPGRNLVTMIYEDWPVFPEKRVNYIGEPLMLLLGPDKERLASLLDAVEVDIEEDTPVLDYSHSGVHLHYEKGDSDKAFADADRIIEETYTTGYQEQAYIEPQGFVGYIEDETYTVIGSIQCPYYVHEAVKVTLDETDENVRVLQAPVGGAFGGKEEFPSVMATQLAVALKKIKRPIKMIYEREEDMVSTTKRHPSKTTIRAAVKDGRITGMTSHIGIDGGAYIGLSEVVLSRGMLAATNAYTIEHLDVDGDVYLTNTVPNGAFRGFGAPQMIYAIEMFMHHAAKELGEDPFSFRKAHMVKQGDWTSTGGKFRDPILLDEMIEKAADISDYHKKRKAYEDENVYKGIGMSWFFHGCGFTGSGEQHIIKSRVEVEKDAQDTVYIHVAAVDMGQGPKTTLRKIVADVLDLPIERVIFDYPDTHRVPDSGPTVASRTAMIVGGLLARAAKTLKETWREGEAQKVEKRYQQPDYVEWDGECMKGDAYPAYSWGVNVVEVEVDKHTYEIDVKDVYSVYDLGKAIDERIVLGQADGGQAQGVAYGYLEVMSRENGRLKQTNMTDYIIPTAMDMPKTDNHLIDNPYPYGPYGAKGGGELTLVGGAPAVAQAIEQAVGRRVRDIPATPEYLMELIHNG